ncbi:IS5 family transposase, partial [Neisseria meningitidis]
METFAKFLSLPTAETQTQVFGCFRPKYLLILPKYPLNPARIPDNQASG